MFSIIVVNFENSELTEFCIKKTIKFLATTDLVYEIVIVDNNSKDKSFEYLRDAFSTVSNVAVYTSGHNGGFGFGCNFGATLAQYDWLFFLSSDGWIVDWDISALENDISIDDRDLGAVACKVLLIDGSRAPLPRHEMSFSALLLSSAGAGRVIRMLPSSLRVKLARAFKSIPGVVGQYFGGFLALDDSVKVHGEQAADVFQVGGGAFFINKSAFQKVEGFDEMFFLYDEDADLSARLRSAGFINRYSPAVTVQMYISATTSKLSDWRLRRIKKRSRHRLINKHFYGVRRFILNFITSITWVRL